MGRRHASGIGDQLMWLLWGSLATLCWRFGVTTVAMTVFAVTFVVALVWVLVKRRDHRAFIERQRIREMPAEVRRMAAAHGIPLSSVRSWTEREDGYGFTHDHQRQPTPGQVQRMKLSTMIAENDTMIALHEEWGWWLSAGTLHEVNDVLREELKCAN